MQVRRHLYYSGDVQGVGFRYTARGLAGGRAVAGFVRNLPDGRVEIVVEGQGAEADGFLAAVAEEMGGAIRDIEAADEPPTGEFVQFSVRF